MGATWSSGRTRHNAGDIMRKIITILSIAMLCSIAWAITENLEMFEQTGIETNNHYSTESPSVPPNPKPLADWSTGILLIPDFTTDSIGLFDPYDGTFLRFLCKSPTASSPKNAIQGPDGRIYVADQVADAVTMFDTLGNFLGVYADASDGLDNIRGIDFRAQHLFICNSPSSGTKGVWEFSGPHTFVRHFITYTGVDPFDIYFLPDGRCLFSDIGTSDKIALHDTNGTFIQTVVTTNFPEQIQNDRILPGAFLAAAFSSNQIIDFDLDGSIFRTFSLSGARGVYRLGNGNILATYGTNVIEMDSATGATVQVEKTGSFQYIELYITSGLGTSEININKYLIDRIVKIQPNPFKYQTAIEYNLYKPAKVMIKIYNSLGREIRSLVNQHHTQGIYSINWDGKDNNGIEVPNGIYICNLGIGAQNSHRQLIKIK